MQTKMIAKYIAISYVCPKCGLRFTSQGGVYDNSEFSEKIFQRIKNSRKSCMACKKLMTIPKSIVCRVDPIINQNYYEIEWECEECNTKWHSIHDLNPNQISFGPKLANIKNTTVCINENCRSSKVKTVSLIFNRKI